MECTFAVMHWTRHMVVRYRRSLKLTQAQFADRCGTTQAMISRVESGKTEIWPMLAKLLTCMVTTEGVAAEYETQTPDSDKPSQA